MAGEKIIISVTNDLVGDQRVHRAALTLHEAGYDVTLVGRVTRDSKALKDRPYRTRRMRLMFRRGKLFYLAFNFRLFWFLQFRRARLHYANDLDTLLANFMAARLRGRRLLYDSHELFAEVPELVSRPGTRKVWLWLEKRLFPRLKQVITVNRSIADRYEEAYGVKPSVVRNLPFRRAVANDRDHAPRVILYQGALNMGRGIELMIRSMAFLPEYRLRIAGSGTDAEALRGLAKSEGLEDRVEFLGHVPLEELVKITATAGLGLSLEEDLGENYRLALPNKLFDYIQCGTPVLISDLPEMARVVKEYGVGELLSVEEREPELLAARMRAMLENEVQYLEYHRACREAAKELNWESEKEVLLRAVRAALA